MVSPGLTLPAILSQPVPPPVCCWRRSSPGRPGIGGAGLSGSKPVPMSGVADAAVVVGDHGPAAAAGLAVLALREQAAGGLDEVDADREQLWFCRPCRWRCSCRRVADAARVDERHEQVVEGGAHPLGPLGREEVASALNDRALVGTRTRSLSMDACRCRWCRPGARGSRGRWGSCCRWRRASRPGRRRRCRGRCRPGTRRSRAHVALVGGVAGRQHGEAGVGLRRCRRCRSRRGSSGPRWRSGCRRRWSG
jgi:hypothetical protein